MGSTVSSSRNISRTELYKSPNDEDQSVVYSTHDSKTCTLRAIVGVETANVTMRDYTFDNKGTIMNIKLRREGGCMGEINLTYEGNALEVRNKNDGQFIIVYGVAHVRCGVLDVVKYATKTHGDALFLTHIYGTTEHKLSVVVLEVWYDVGKGRFMCNLTGPTRYSSILEALEDTKDVFPPNYVNEAEFSTFVNKINKTNKTTITGLINNTGSIYGNLNGSIINFFR